MNDEKELKFVAFALRAAVLALSIFVGFAIIMLATVGTLFLLSNKAQAKEPAQVTTIGEPSSSRRYFDDIRDPVRLIFFRTDDNSGYSQCSGIMISTGRMLTAAHCVSNEMWVMDRDIRTKATLIKKHAKSDIALLEVEFGCPCAVLEKGLGGLDRDDVVALVGFPEYKVMRTQILYEGRYQGVVDDMFVVTSPIGRGASGGGVFLKRGKWILIGVISAFLSNDDKTQTGNLMVVTPADLLMGE